MSRGLSWREGGVGTGCDTTRSTGRVLAAFDPRFREGLARLRGHRRLAVAAVLWRLSAPLEPPGTLKCHQLALVPGDGDTRSCRQFDAPGPIGTRSSARTRDPRLEPRGPPVPRGARAKACPVAPLATLAYSVGVAGRNMVKIPRQPVRFPDTFRWIFTRCPVKYPETLGQNPGTPHALTGDQTS